MPNPSLQASVHSTKSLKVSTIFRIWVVVNKCFNLLNIVDPFKDFVVCTDTCNEGLGRVLLQENYGVAYESRKLKEHEKKYATHDLELVAIIHALKMWRHYLIGRKLLLMSENISLKYLFDQHNLNARQARWLSFYRRI